MVEHVVGEWKQFTFKMATPEDYPKILKHLRKVYYVEEPLCKIAQYGEEEYDFLDQLILTRLNQNDKLSFYVEETKTRKMAGVRLIYKSTKESDSKSILEQSDAPTLPKLRKTAGYFDFLSKKSSLMFEKYRVDYYAYLFVTSVDPEFQRQGLASEMYNRAIKFLQAKGYPACQCIFTSPFTRRVAEKMNFEELATVYFIEYVDDKGEIVFPNAEPDMCGSAMALRLL